MEGPRLELVASVVVASLVVGCGPWNAPASPLALTNGWTGAEALFDGGVVAVDEDCVTLTDRRSGTPLTLAWPREATSWDAERRVILFEGVVVGAGDVISVGGSSDIAPPGGWHKEPSGECPDDVWFVGGVEHSRTSRADSPD